MGLGPWDSPIRDPLNVIPRSALVGCTTRFAEKEAVSPPTGTHEATVGLGRPLALRRRPFPGTPILPQSFLLQRASSPQENSCPSTPATFATPGFPRPPDCQWAPGRPGSRPGSGFAKPSEGPTGRAGLPRSPGPPGGGACGPPPRRAGWGRRGPQPDKRAPGRPGGRLALLGRGVRPQPRNVALQPVSPCLVPGQVCL